MKRYLVSICIPLVANDLVSILAGCISCLENYLFFAHFKIGFFVFIFTVKISYIFYLQVSYQINYVQKFSPILWVVFFFNFFKLVYLFFRERGREGEREEEKHQCVVASHVPPTGELACNPGLCPDWELNRRSFGLQPELNPLSHTSQDLWVVF